MCRCVKTGYHEWRLPGNSIVLATLRADRLIRTSNSSG